MSDAEWAAQLEEDVNYWRGQLATVDTVYGEAFVRQELAAAEQYLAEHRQAMAREAERGPEQPVPELRRRSIVVQPESE